MRKLALVLTLVLPWSPLTGASAGTPLNLGVVPYEAADRVRENFRPFAEYLSKRMGQEVRVYVGTDYVAINEALHAGHVQLVVLSPFPYVLASSKTRMIPLFTTLEIREPGKRGTPYYRGAIITRKDSGIKSVRDLRGKRMAFIDPASTSGHLYPAELMLRNGVDPRTDLKMSYYAGNADALVRAVASGNADAGALYEGGMERVLKDPDKIAQMRVVAFTRKIPNVVLAARADLGMAGISRLRGALSDLDRSDQCEKICGPFNVNGWVPARDSDFDPVRRVARLLKLSKDTK